MHLQHWYRFVPGGTSDWEPEIQQDLCIRIWSPDLIQEGQWHHLVLILNRAVLKNSSYSLFVDGQHISTKKVCSLRHRYFVWRKFVNFLLLGYRIYCRCITFLKIPEVAPRIWRWLLPCTRTSGRLRRREDILVWCGSKASACSLRKSCQRRPSLHCIISVRTI